MKYAYETNINVFPLLYFLPFDVFSRFLLFYLVYLRTARVKAAQIRPFQKALYLLSIEANSSDVSGSRAQGGSLDLTEPKLSRTARCLLSKNTPIYGCPYTPIRPWSPNQPTGDRCSSGQRSQQAAK